MIRLKSITILSLLLAFINLSAQTETQKPDEKEKIKTDWTFGGLPTIAYDADMGFQYGALVNMFYYGNGTTYPEYLHTFKVEVSRYTKGSGVNQFFYDSKYLIPGKTRLTADVSYLTERALDFYGFNGYKAKYMKGFADDESDDYVSRVFYRHERKLLRVILDFQRPTNIIDNLRWLAGFNFYDIRTGSVDIEKLNKGQSDEDKLPDVPLLYDKYVEWGLISEKEKEGGSHKFIKLGLVYDTRDNESNPSKGIWTEALLMTAPRFLGNNDFACTRFSAIHRQYFSIIKKRLIFAYRLGYQGTLDGETPFYLYPLMMSSFSTATKSDGLGGAKTLRGILRNRVIGEDVAYANLEFRWKFFRTVLWKQNLYFALIGFSDVGQACREISIDKSNIPEDINQDLFFGTSGESLHLSYGAGFRLALNENFIIAIDYGFAADGQDGSRGLYININNLF